MDKYDVLGIIGTGAQATAYLVENKSTKKRFVMKRVVPACREMIEQEVQILLQLSHPNVVRYVECFEHELCLHIVTEYYPGGDLERLLAAIRKKGQIVSPEIAKAWILQLCSALQYIHERNIIHRDIKCANVFLSEDQRTVALGDFGIAKKLDNAKHMTNTLVGSPYGFSPELVSGKSYDSKSDMWSLGCVVYEICNLRRAFEVDNISQLISLIQIAKYGAMEPTVPPPMKSIIERLLQKDPRERPNAKDVLGTLSTSGRRGTNSASNNNNNNN
eukprot:PhM_4_TR3662/c1_g1_i1/m.76360/K08857/NEK1_4_5; NIMA (never in mitosis gene a)-related kinase 1/4/5